MFPHHFLNVTTGLSRVRKDEPAGGSAVNLGPLPEWNLADLYSAPDGADLAADFAAAEQRTTAFEILRGKVEGLDSEAFGAVIAEYETLSEIMGQDRQLRAVVSIR